MIGQRFVCQAIEGTRPDVGVEFPIPRRRVELRVPATKRRQLFVGERFDILFQPFELAHTSVYPTVWWFG